MFTRRRDRASSRSTERAAMYFTKEPRFTLVYSAIVFPIVAIDLALMMTGYRAAAFSIVFIALVPLFVAEMVKVSAKTAERTERRLILSSPLAPEAVFQRLAGAAFGRRLKLVDGDLNRRALVLSSPMRGWSMGFFYPVFIKPSASGSQVEIGIVKRAPQHERTTAEWHKTCADEIEKALAA
jgi:hypothetical protein